MSIEPQTTEYNLIYIYSRKAHPGALKIGMTRVKAYDYQELTPNCQRLKDAAYARIKEQTATSAVDDVTFEYAEVACFEGKDENGDTKTFAFHDCEVHTLLERSGYERADFQNDFGAPREWFTVNLETAQKAIAAVKQGLEYIDGPPKPKKAYPEIKFREEQQNAIATTIAHYQTGRRILWNAKMRFGKTLCALELIRRQNYKRVLILTHRPAVQDSWFGDYHLLEFHNHQYGSKKGDKYAKCGRDDQNGKDFETLRHDLSVKNTGYIYFASMQDLRGSKSVSEKGINKNDDVFRNQWDLIILDEAHEGMETPLGKNVINALCENRDPFFLFLSGTPYNILKNFSDDEIFLWDYLMEQEAKETWPEKHPGEPNPYEGLAKMNILTYYLGDVFAINNYTRTDDDFFDFREFFAVENGVFKHEEHVKLFLDMLCDHENPSRYPYSTMEFRRALNHTFWMLPGVKEAERLCVLLSQHRLCKEFGFHVVNVAGEGKQAEEADEDDAAAIEKADKNALAKVKDAIKHYEKTITLSCGRLTTGVSVPEWTGVFMLRGGVKVNAGNYMQTIFRGQTPFKNGAIKTNCYAFDFAPDRAVAVIDEYLNEEHKLSEKQRQKNGDGATSRNDYTAKMLHFCPVIAMRGGQEVDFSAIEFIKRVNEIIGADVKKHGAKSRMLHRSFSEFNDQDFALLEEIGKLFNGKTVKTDNNGNIVLADSGLDPEKNPSDDGKNKGKDRGGKGGKKNKEPVLPQPKKKAEDHDQRRRAQNVFDEIFVRLSLLMFGIAEHQQLTVEKLLADIDDVSWSEFMPSRVTKNIIRQILHLLNEQAIIGYADSLVEAVRAADTAPVEQRIALMAAELAKLHYPDHETVLTPWRVVNLHLGNTIGGYNFYNEQYSAPIVEPRWVEHDGVTGEVFGTDEPHLLEINSKSGVYPLYLAYTLWRVKCEKLPADTLTEEKKQQIWQDVLRNNIFVLCKTNMARKITERVLRGFQNLETHCVYRDGLVETLKLPDDNKQKKQLLAELVSAKFWNISDKEENMKFNAVVGNPPYQEEKAKQLSQTNGQAPRASVFHYFQMASDLLSTCVTSLIYPGARWIHRSGKGMSKFGLEQINDSRLSRIDFYPDSQEIFKEVAIADGLSIVLKESQKKSKGFVYVYHKGENQQTVYMDNPGENLIPLNPKNDNIIRKVTEVVSSLGLSYLHDRILPRNLFGIESNFVENHPNSVREYAIDQNFDVSTEIKLLTNDKAGKSGRARWYIANRNIIAKDSQEFIDRWQVVVSSANAGGQKRDNQIGIIDNHSAFGRVRVALGSFQTQKEAENFYSYAQSKLIKFLFLMTDESLTSLGKRVPDFGDYSDKNKIIDFGKDIDEQLCTLFSLTKEEILFIDTLIRPRT